MRGTNETKTSGRTVFLDCAVALSQLTRDCFEDLHASPNTARTGLTDPEMHRLNRRTTQRSLDLLFSCSTPSERNTQFFAAHLLEAAILTRPECDCIHLSNAELIGVLTSVRSKVGSEAATSFYLNQRIAGMDRDFIPQPVVVLGSEAQALVASAGFETEVRATWNRVKRTSRWVNFPSRIQHDW